MAIKGIGYVTLADVAKNGSKVAEVLVRENPMLEDIPYKEMNEGTIHKESIRSYLPKPTYRKANQAIAAQKSGIEERTFSAAHFESRSQMDKMVARRGGMDKVAINRWNQAQGHIQAMANEHASLLFYGSPSDVDGKTPGFADIFWTRNTGVETSKQIVHGGGASNDNTSIWLINWGAESVFGIYPAGTTAGLKRTDYSEGGKLVQLQGKDEAGNVGTFYGYDEIFELDHGLVVKDFRQVVRIANLPMSDLQGATPATKLIDLLITAQYRLYKMDGAVIYMNRIPQAILHKQALAAVGTGGGLTFDNFGGKKILHFNGMPIRTTDALLNNEATVTT